MAVNMLSAPELRKPFVEWVLKRTYYPEGTNGVLFSQGVPVCATIELPWNENRVLVSCIPEGRYVLKRRSSRRLGPHLLLNSVPGRSLILIHPANDARLELKGCMAPVLKHTGAGRGAGSRKAMQLLLKMAAGVWEADKELLLQIQGSKS